MTYHHNHHSHRKLLHYETKLHFGFKKEEKTDKGGGGTKDRIERTEHGPERTRYFCSSKSFSTVYNVK